MWDWILTNKEWAFSGVGVVFLTGLVGFLNKKRAGNDATSTITVNNVNNLTSGPLDSSKSDQKTHSFDALKAKTHILFIDDETDFKVVKIIKKHNGWLNTKIVADVSSLDQAIILEANILFIDIQGVGKALSFADEGLGLALAIKRKYPEKFIIIYSAQTSGERFHKALNEADASLPKNAEPYEFIKLIEDFSKQTS